MWVFFTTYIGKKNGRKNGPKQRSEKPSEKWSEKRSEKWSEKRSETVGKMVRNGPQKRSEMVGNGQKVVWKRSENGPVLTF